MLDIHPIAIELLHARRRHHHSSLILLFENVEGQDESLAEGRDEAVVGRVGEG